MDKNTNQNTKKMKTSDKVRYVIGVCCILGMLGGFSDGDILSALFLGILGVTLLPIFYDKLLYDKFKIKQNRYLPIIIPVVAFLFMCFCMPTDTETTTALDESINSSISNENTVKEDINIYEEKTTEKNEDITLNETKEDSTQEQESSTSKAEEVKQEAVATSTSRVDTPKQNTTTSTTPKAEEPKQVTTTPTTPKVEEPKQETTTPVTPKVEEPKQEVTTPTTSQPSQNTNNSRGVYRTPHGKRYHFDAECGGKNSYSTNLDTAISAGLTPCEKCAQ